MSVWLADASDSVLTTPAADVAEDEFGPQLYQLVHAMFDLMHRYHGIGLAASQISVSKRVIVWDIGTGPDVAINPVIIDLSDRLVVHVEGCLSLPDCSRAIERPAAVRLRYRSLTGIEVEHAAAGLLARVLQHEVDHTRGVLMTDHPVAEARPMIGPPTPF